MHNFYKLKHDKFMPILVLAMSAMIGCVIACLHNSTPLPSALRGFATAYSVFAIPVVLHSLLRHNIGGFRWMLLGIAISGVVTIFAFHNSAELSKASSSFATNTTSALKEGQLFWLSHFGAWPVLPVQGWYLHTPMPYAVVAPLIMTFYTILVSASGRASIMIALLSSVLILLGRKTRKSIAALQRNIIFTAMICALVLGVVASLYKYAGRAGLLNKQAQQKYEQQMKKAAEGSGFSLLRMIMAGRLEFFVGLYECFQAPIIGYGPWAFDTEGVYEEFLSKYGDAEDYDNYLKHQQYLARTYNTRSYTLIGGHSHVLQFWLAYGILGLPYWLYVIFLVCQFFKRYLSFLPHYFGFFVTFSCSFFWDVFFSPFSARMGYGLFITMLLLIRAAAMGRVAIPFRLIAEARLHEE